MGRGGNMSQAEQGSWRGLCLLNQGGKIPPRPPSLPGEGNTHTWGAPLLGGSVSAGAFGTEGQAAAQNQPPLCSPTSCSHLSRSARAAKQGLNQQQEESQARGSPIRDQNLPAGRWGGSTASSVG